ncbi:MAG: Rieske 2Fe-2S domain-containing protein [Desulfobacterales bacterium]|jgi:cytochrome b6-f complex iron-sulfur subunit
MAPKNDNAAAVPEPGRRRLLSRIWFGLGLVALGEVAVVIWQYFKPSGSGRADAIGNQMVVCGPAERFAPGTVTAFVQGRFYLARLEDGGFLALSRQCTHLGCTVPWIEAEKRFACPCHGSAFDIAGDAVDAPASRALNLFAVSIENDVVRVDTGRAIRRDRFRGEQAVYVKTT